MIKNTKKNWMIAIATVIATYIPATLHDVYMLKHNEWTFNWKSMQWEKKDITIVERDIIETNRRINWFAWSVIRLIVYIFVNRKYMEK
jgi:hypothetical protein